MSFVKGFNRRDVMLGAGAAALAAPLYAKAIARERERSIIINGLGGIGNPNASRPNEAQLAAHYLDPRGIRDARDAGLTATNLTLGHVFGEGDPFEKSVADIAWWDSAIRKRPELLLKVLSTDDIRIAQESRRIGVVYGFQNTEMLGDDTRRVDIFADLGVRVVQLTYNLRNKVGDGALAQENAGLTDFGREVVWKLNDRQLLIDLSHGAERTTMDALEASAAPIAITHTGCAALAPHPRNKTDAELRRVAEKSGVIGIYWMPYLTPGRQHLAADIVAHIEHALSVCGEDHVGIGTDGSIVAIDDMDAYRERLRRDVENRRKTGVGAPGETADITLSVPDLMGADQFRKLGDLLAERGHGRTRIGKVLGGNFMRLFGDVWGE